MTGLLFAILVASTFFQPAEIKDAVADSASESSTNSVPAYAFNGA
jgi:hypothetical protein